MSYDMIDRFLRNNLGDDDYAEYSAALDELVAPPAQPAPVQVSIEMVPDPVATIYPKLYKATWEAMHGPAPVQEPVLWMRPTKIADLYECDADDFARNFSYEQGGVFQTPLYTTPPAQPAPDKEPLSELEKDAANLLFALHDAWPYVHGHCTIESKKKAIQALMVKHGDFADLQPTTTQPAPVQEQLGARCADGGKCHHQCTERCFRRECCAPFSDYVGPWSYTTPPAQPPVQEKPYAYANPHDLFANTAFRWCEINEYTMPVYTTPPAAQPAVPLTDEQLNDLADRCTPNTETGALRYRVFARAIEAHHGITKGQP